MKVTVTTLWGAGFVSVASKYVLLALSKKEGLEIQYKDAVLNVSYDDLLKKKPREDKFKDKFGRKKDYGLYDFWWGKKI